MKRYLLYILILCSAWLCLAACERSYDDPEPAKIWTRAEVESDGFHFISIAALKQMYYDVYSPSTIGQGVVITDEIAIEGKVVSDDEAGNVYKSIYIQDASGAIEIKLGTYSNYLRYAAGQTVYVKCKGLTLGNYRYNLSIGAASEDDSYANSNLDVKSTIRRTVLPGSRGTLTSADTTVITSPDQLHDGLLGRLVRIVGATSFHGEWSGDNYPSFLETIYTIEGATQYNNYAFWTVIEQWRDYYAAYAIWEKNPSSGPEPTKPVAPEPAVLDYPTLAYSYDNNKYYGSTLLRIGNDESDPTHNLVLRTSGYADFALYPVPENGATVDVTAIYTKYSSSSGGFIKYQLLLNKVKDLVVR